ncbi:HAD family hydrolase [Nonomuraea longicatena]|uniref:HAD family hydrolase n=1 Tax=Nonomuraea longicatena TaxID=83682 RepID=A0ABN1QL60_9ACTN
MLIVDFDGVVCDALAECALVTWLGGHRDRPWSPGRTELRRVPPSFVRRFRMIRDYARTLDHFVLAHLPDAQWIRERRDFERIFRALPRDYVRDFTAAASAARRRIREEEPDFWLGMHTLYPGISALLERHSGRVAVVTAKDEESVRDILRRHGLEHTVTEVVGECADKAGAVRDLCARRRIRPAQAVFVDDSLTNVRRVAAVGVRARWATWGYHTPEDLRDGAHPDIHPLDLAEVPDLVV